MKQSLHILKKDLQRFAWEIAASLLVLAVYGWSQPVSWLPPDVAVPDNSATAYWRYLGSNLSGLVLVLAWTAILIRVLSEDSPTGDRQFWLTRPLRWQNLLAAKVLFFVVVVHIPLLIVQLMLVRAAGFSPLHHFSTLWRLQLFLAAAYLCVAAFGVVATGGRQLARALIVVLIFLLIWLYQGSIDFQFATADGRSRWGWVIYPMLVAVALVVIVRQYALRKTAQARWLLFITALALTLANVYEPAWTLDQTKYPQLSVGTGSSFTINLSAPSLPKRVIRTIGGKSTDHVLITLNFSATGVAPGTVVKADAARVVLQSPDGKSWDSGWLRLYSILDHDEETRMEAGQNQLGVSLWIDGKFYDREKDVPLTAHVVLAATLMRDREIPQAPGANEYTITGVGDCAPYSHSAFSIWCRSAQEHVPLFGVKENLYKSCSGETGEQPVMSNTAWAPYARSFEFGLSPVRSLAPYFDRRAAEARSLVKCPGTPVSFRLPEKLQGFRVEKEVGGVKLADYVDQQ